MLLVARDAPSRDDFYRAAILLVLAMFCDLLDGRVARMTKTQSAFGLQLDSLADIVSFGVAPALLLYKWTLFQLPVAGAFAAFLFVGCGALRLARFNVLATAPSGQPQKPGKYMVGLPIPPAAAVVISLVLADHACGGRLSAPRYSWSVLTVTIILALMMVSTLSFRSFKEVRLNFGTGLFVTAALGSSLLVWRLSHPQFVLVWLLGMYLGLGVFESLALLSRALLVRSERPSFPPTG